MTIATAYQKYAIPINLQEHMLRTGALAKLISNNFQNIKITKNLIIKTCLLHDMGNILKFDLSKIDLLDDQDKSRVAELKKTKNNFIKKYGHDPEEATIAIIGEISKNKQIKNLCELSHWESIDDFLAKKNFAPKIVCYTDMRIGPFGILSLKNRFDNLVLRRPKSAPVLNGLFAQAESLEKQIQSNCQINLQKITNQMLESEFQKLLSLKI